MLWSFVVSPHVSSPAASLILRTTATGSLPKQEVFIYPAEHHSVDLLIVPMMKLSCRRSLSF